MMKGRFPFVILLCIHLMSLIYHAESGVSVTTDRPIPVSWGGLRSKLNQILDSESREVSILQNLLTDSESSGSVSSDEIIKDEKNAYEKSRKLESIGQKFFLSSESSPPSDSVSSLREKGIISKLDDNSKRMDNMVVVLADLRNVLSDAITAQSKQMTFEGEVVELREEIEYLRKEIQMLKKEQALSSLTHSPSLENKIQNDETTIQWLKESNKELHSQMTDLSRSCNTTAIIEVKQKLDQQSQRQQSDLLIFQRQIEGIQVQQLRQDEEIIEAKGNIEDVRSWQTNMGQKFMDTQRTFSEVERSSNEVSNNEMFAEEEHFLTEAYKESNKLDITPTRHSKKLKAKLKEITKNAKQLAQDHYRFHKRLVKIEASQKIMKGVVGNVKKMLNSDSKYSGKDKSIEISNRITGLQHTMSEYTLTLQGLGDKVNAVNELKESSSQLFAALEELETRYDHRLTEMQTTLAKMEASVSSISNSNENLQEQQSFQAGIIQGMKKNIFEAKGKLQTNHLRLASIQSQLLKWSSQKCSNENSESIQNIRISSLESMIQTREANILEPVA